MATERDKLREQLQRDVERFLQEGGKVTELAIEERKYSAIFREDRKRGGPIDVETTPIYL